MRADNKEIQRTVTSLINDAGRSPFLFLGSGFSRRYLGTENWDDLLRSLCSLYSDDPFLFEKYQLEVREFDPPSQNPAIASLMERDLRKAVLENPRLADFRDKNIEAVRSNASLLKICAADHFSSFTERKKEEELGKLIEAGKRRIAGVITTNYDTLAEGLFPGFKTFVGQEDLLFQQLYENGEIYKIHGSVSDPQSMVLNAEDYDLLGTQQDYLVAKLLTIFVEYPIIFIGYSLSDPDIRSILQSLAKCLSREHLALLKNRLIFIGRGENDISNYSMDFGDIGAIEMTRISTDDFGFIYEGIGDSYSRFAPKVLRELKRNVYELVETTTNTSSIRVTGLESLDALPEDLEVVLGVGAVAAGNLKHGHMIKQELLFHDVIDDDEYLIPALVVEEYLPNLLKSNVGLPMYKYLALYDKEVTDPRILKHIAEDKDIDSFLHLQQIKWKEKFRATCSKLSVNAIVGHETTADACKKLLYLEKDEIDLDDLRRFLSNVLKSRKDVLKGNTDLRKLIRVYDFLKYKDASVTAANSESLETPN